MSKSRTDSKKDEKSRVAKTAVSEQRIKVSLDQMEKIKAAEALASRVTCQRRS